MSDTLQAMSQAMAELVESAGAGIVRVEARRRLPATGIVWSPDGVIVTAHHVVEHDEGIRIGLPGGDSVAAQLVGRDASTDLAVLRAEASGLAAAGWAAASDLRVGHLVLALGRPGRTVQATLGIVSALGGEWQTPGGGKVDAYVQTDVVMYPGFSGGPLVTASGQVAGVNTSALAQGVSLAVPAATVKRVVETLLAHGRVPRGYLGVGVQPVRLPDALQADLGQETGLMIMSVEPGGPAAKGGVLQGDILVALGGQPVRHLDELHAFLQASQGGAAVELRLVRGGQPQTLAVTLGEHR